MQLNRNASMTAASSARSSAVSSSARGAAGVGNGVDAAIAESEALAKRKRVNVLDMINSKAAYEENMLRDAVGLSKIVQEDMAEMEARAANIKAMAEGVGKNGAS